MELEGTWTRSKPQQYINNDFLTNKISSQMIWWNCDNCLFVTTRFIVNHHSFFSITITPKLHFTPYPSCMTLFDMLELTKNVMEINFSTTF